jgi:GGDEF domain-containing protein
MSTGMLIDGVLGSEAIDSSGEVLDVEGADISDVENGTLLLNWEHQPGEQGPGTLVGKVIAAKKIYSASDCDNERQRKYWDDIQLPFIYGVMRLYDGAGHPEAQRIAAIIRDHVANDEMVVCRFSVEGSTLSKEGNRLKESVIRRVAVTVKPCNRTANSGLIEDPNAPDGFEKTHAKEKTKDLLDLDLVAEKSEAEHPLFMRLGGTSEVACNPVVEEAGLTKAYTAGVASGAPGTLTGGAALGREEIGRTKDKILALVREHGGRHTFSKDEFRAALVKMNLPEASDEFLDHFVNVAEDYHVKRSQLSKKEEGKAKAPSAGPQVAPPLKAKAVKVAVKEPVDEEDAAPIKIAHGTIRGVPCEPIKMRGYNFDEANGVLHTPKGSFPLYNPDKGFPTVEAKDIKSPHYRNGALHVAPGTDMKAIPHNPANPGFREIYNSQPIEDFHSGKVMPNWVRVHQLTKAGRLPEEVILHSAMFSMMSPNTPVRPHELMYAHMADTFEDLGIDARDPDFKRARRHWLDKDQGTNYPRTGSEYFKQHPDVHLGNESKEKGRPAGQLMGFMLGENKFANVAQYHKLHQTLVDMVKRHGVDSRSATKELMGLKHQQLLWKNKRGAVKLKAKQEGAAAGLKNHLTDYMKAKEAAHGKLDERQAKRLRQQWRDEATKLGLKDDLSAHAENAAQQQVGEYKGTPVPGLAPKTGRFTFTMLGGGNTFVPDTHVIRHLFGMDPDKDGDTLAYLKSVLWNANNHHILEGVDRWYAKNHPAAQIMQKHPKWGEVFKDDREQANFPAFWRHWCSIASDERARGISNKSANEFSTHEPFWLGIEKLLPEVKKSETEGLDHGLIGRMIAFHSQYERDYGEIPGQMMFMTHLLPHLLEASDHRQKHDDLSDFVKAAPLHALEMTLKKAANDLESAALADPSIPSVHAVYLKMNGEEHRAGRFVLFNNELHHLEDYYGLLHKLLPPGRLDLKRVSTIHGLKMAPNVSVRVERPEPADDQHEGTGKPRYVSMSDLGVSLPTSMRPPSVFAYHRAGMDRPHTLEVSGGKYLLDGNELTHPEVQTILGNAKTGLATVRYQINQGATVRKMESTFSLKKADEDLHELTGNDTLAPSQDYLAAIRAAEEAGHVPKGTAAGLTRHLYEDPMTPGIGNKKAWEEFQLKNKPGVHVAMDGTDFSAVNNAFGHKVGDDAIRTYGSVLRDAMKESGAQGKLFRAGGDEMNAYFPSHEHAMGFARKVHEKLEAVPPVQGIHKLSIGMGLGTSPEQADKALYAAKEQKYLPGQEHLPARERKRAFKVGAAPNMAHSLVPGHEGAIPLHDSAAEATHATLIQPPPAPAPTPGEDAQYDNAVPQHEHLSHAAKTRGLSFPMG